VGHSNLSCVQAGEFGLQLEYAPFAESTNATEEEPPSK